MKSLQIVIGHGQPVTASRHRFGQRRSGLPAPDCPSCARPMMCLFSFDGRDEILAGSQLPVADVDYDVFVCISGCPILFEGYATRWEADGSVGVRFSGEAGVALSDIVTCPQPAPVELVLLADQAPPTDEEAHNDYVSRQVPPGVYHRICPYLLWGAASDGEPEACRFCGSRTHRALITDSDEQIRMAERYGADPTAHACSLNWGDQDYLSVRFCPTCGAFGVVLVC